MVTDEKLIEMIKKAQEKRNYKPKIGDQCEYSSSCSRHDETCIYGKRLNLPHFSFWHGETTDCKCHDNMKRMLDCAIE